MDEQFALGALESLSPQPPDAVLAVGTGGALPENGGMVSGDCRRAEL